MMPRYVDRGTLVSLIISVTHKIRDINIEIEIYLQDPIKAWSVTL